MIYLTGATNDEDEPSLIANGIGLMIQPGNSYHLRSDRYPFYAIDCGMKWSDAEPYLAWLESRSPVGCLFAVSPDAYPDAAESQRRGLEFAPLIRAMGFPVAIVAQDGAEDLTWPWEDFDVLFIGGQRETKWKTSQYAEGLCRRARAQGLWVHMGRVNSSKRLERARAMGCNSADGTFLKHWRRKRAGESRSPRHGGEVSRWVEILDVQRTLPGFTDFEMPNLAVHRRAVIGRDDD